MSGDVEFLDMEDGAAPAGELLDCGSPRRRPAPRVLLAAATAAAVLAALILRVPDGGSRQAPAPPLPHPIPVPPQPTLTIPGPSPFGGGNVTMTFGGGRLFALSATRLGALDPSADGTSGRRSVAVSLDLEAQDSFGLVWNGATRSVWVLPLFGRQPGLLREYGTDLRLRRTVPLSDIAHAGTVLDGVLYVSTSSGISAIGRTGRPRQLPIPKRAFHRYGAFGDVQADPARHRLLYVTYAYSAYLESWSPRTGRSRVVRLNVANPTLAVVAGRIWLAGFRRSAGVLEQLDPDTLQPVDRSALAPELGPGAVIVDAAQSSILVRSGTDPAPLWCLDARTGRVRERWSGPSGAVSGAGRDLFVATTSSVRRLTVGGCPG